MSKRKKKQDISVHIHVRERSLVGRYPHLSRLDLDEGVIILEPVKVLSFAEYREQYPEYEKEGK